MQFQSSQFVAWQEAENRAAEAERVLFEKVLSPDAADRPTRDEVQQVRLLRETANLLLQQMLEEMRLRAASLNATPASHSVADRILRGRGAGSAR
jgi:hypothetical protein